MFSCQEGSSLGDESALVPVQNETIGRNRLAFALCAITDSADKLVTKASKPDGMIYAAFWPSDAQPLVIAAVYARISTAHMPSYPVISMSLRHKPATRSGRRGPLGRAVTSQIPQFVSAWNFFAFASLEGLLPGALRVLSESQKRHFFMIAILAI